MLRDNEMERMNMKDNTPQGGPNKYAPACRADCRRVRRGRMAQACAIALCATDCPLALGRHSQNAAYVGLS